MIWLGAACARSEGGGAALPQRCRLRASGLSEGRGCFFRDGAAKLNLSCLQLLASSLNFSWQFSAVLNRKIMAELRRYWDFRNCDMSRPKTFHLLPRRLPHPNSPQPKNPGKLEMKPTKENGPPSAPRPKTPQKIAQPACKSEDKQTSTAPLAKKTERMT